MADLILHNANAVTLDPLLPKARLIAVRERHILAATIQDDLKPFRKRKTTLIDCRGRTVLPGFIDAHCHMKAFAESFVTLRLEPRDGVRSLSDLQRMIADTSCRLPAGTWIRGRGYNEFHLSEKRHPTRWDLDQAAPAHPVKLSHRTGRAHVLNSLALSLAAISKETPDPPGGLIERDLGTGEPTGLLYGMGGYLSEKIPPMEIRELDRGIRLADRELLSKGITSVQDASAHNGIEEWKMFCRWKDNGLLKPRVMMMLGYKPLPDFREQKFSAPLDKDHLRLGGVKVLIDETTGSLLPGRHELNERVLRIHEAGLQACLHAVEADAVEAACDAIEYAVGKFPERGHRDRIEHCSVCPPSLAARLAALGISVVTQPAFLYYSGERYLRTVPEDQLRHLYPIATLIRQGVSVAGSSDCPVVAANPLIGIYAACSRSAETGEAVLPEERIGSIEALRMFTQNAARAGFEETVKGTLSPGKAADLIVLNADPTAVPVDEIKDIEVEMTILNGEVVWEKD